MRAKLRAFTLIELLIVVAIIAILAAIAVPNFLEARVRAQVSRVKADQRSLATGIESYFTDFNLYPCDLFRSFLGCPWHSSPLELEDDLTPMSTPISYFTDALLEDPLNGKEGVALFEGCDVVNNGGCPDAADREAIFAYVALPGDDLVNVFLPVILGLAPPSISITQGDIESVIRKRWGVISTGPDTFLSFDRCMIDLGPGQELPCLIEQVLDAFVDSRAGIYDPTNGTISRGEVVRNAGGIVFQSPQ